MARISLPEPTFVLAVDNAPHTKKEQDKGFQPELASKAGLRSETKGKGTRIIKHKVRSIIRVMVLAIRSRITNLISRIINRISKEATSRHLRMVAVQEADKALTGQVPALATVVAQEADKDFTVQAVPHTAATLAVQLADRVVR